MHIEIKRDQKAAAIYNERSLASDYKTLLPLLQPGLQVLDVGCGTGAISKDMARAVGPAGSVTGIDADATFINAGLQQYGAVENLTLHHANLFGFQPAQPFDLITAARTLQWIQHPLDAIVQLKRWLKPGGWLSVLDYDHEALQWEPAPPPAMQTFYNAFLHWRTHLGFTNNMIAALPQLFQAAGFRDITIIPADEVYKKEAPLFAEKLGIWSTVAASTQMVDDGFISNDVRLQAIRDYDEWIRSTARSMTMKLSEVRARAN